MTRVSRKRRILERRVKSLRRTVGLLGALRSASGESRRCFAERGNLPPFRERDLPGDEGFRETAAVLIEVENPSAKRWPSSAVEQTLPRIRGGDGSVTGLFRETAKVFGAPQELSPNLRTRFFGVQGLPPFCKNGLAKCKGLFAKFFQRRASPPTATDQRAPDALL